MYNTPKIMYKISVRGTILELDQVVLDLSPFLRTLSQIDVTVFDKFPVEDMRTYIEFCTTGRMRYLIEDVLIHMGYKLVGSCYDGLEPKFIIAEYEDQWHMDRGVLPDPEDTIYTLSSLVSHMLKDRTYDINRKRVRVASSTSCPGNNERLMHNLETILDGQVYAISFDSEIDILRSNHCWRWDWDEL